MALNSEMHEVYLNMPLDVQMMPELQGLPYWARTVHEIMLAVNPQKLTDLNSRGELESYLQRQQERLSEEALILEKDWRKNNPLTNPKDYMERMNWNQHAQLAAREMLREEIEKSLRVLAEEQ